MLIHSYTLNRRRRRRRTIAIEHRALWALSTTFFTLKCPFIVYTQKSSFASLNSKRYYQTFSLLADSNSYKKFKTSNGIKKSSRVLEMKLFELIGNKYSFPLQKYKRKFSFCFSTEDDDRPGREVDIRSDEVNMPFTEQ